MENNEVNKVQREDISPSIDEQPNEFFNLKERLEEIADAVDSDDISLDEALDLYEEAVMIGLQAADLLDVGITAQEEAQARMLDKDAEVFLEASSNGEASEELVDDAVNVMPESDLEEELTDDIAREGDSIEG